MSCEKLTVESTASRSLSAPAVLLVDSDPLGQKIIALHLEKLGCSVCVISDGDQALRALRTQNRFALVLLNCQAPGIDAYEFARSVRLWERTCGCHVGIIGLSAQALPPDVERHLAAGMDEMIGNPADLDALTEALEGWVTLPEVTPGSVWEPLAAAENSYSHPILQGLQQITEDNPKLLLELIDFFLNETPAQLNAILNAVREQDVQALEQAAWSLGAYCGYIGIQGVAQLCAELTTYGRSHLYAECYTLYKLLELEYQAAKMALQVAGNRLTLQARQPNRSQ